MGKRQIKYQCYLNGGLGNQIFQYILLMWIKENTNKKIVIIKSDYTKFKNFYRGLRNVQALYFYNWLITDEEISNKLFILKRFKSRFNNHIKQIFQGYITNKSFIKFLNKDKKDFLEFIINSSFLKSSCIYPQILNYQEFLPYWKKIGELNAIGINQNEEYKKTHDVVIHIRKGDYITGGKTLFALITKNYYNNAINFFIDKLKLNRKLKCLVIGNDLDWARENLRQDVELDYQFESEIIDFYTISKRKYIITANSSFSYAAAMVAMSSLKETIIVCPEKYYQNENDFGIFKNNNWITISN